MLYEDVLEQSKGLLEMFLTEGYSDKDALEKVWEFINGDYDDGIIESAHYSRDEGLLE